MVSPRILRSPSNRPSAVTIRPLRTISSVGCWACEFVKSTDAQQAPKKSIHCRPSFLRAVLDVTILDSISFGRWLGGPVSEIHLNAEFRQSTELNYRRALPRRTERVVLRNDRVAIE